MQVLLRLFKYLPWVDLDTFYAKVKFGDIGFCMGKSENYLFFGNYCSLGSQSCLKHSTNWVYEVEWVSKVKVILWPWSKVTQISKLKLVFSRNSLAIWNQNSYESLRENRNENLFKWVDLDTFYAKVKFGDIGFCMGKSENYLFFGNFCSLRSQSCLKHSTQWVNEVEWVSVVKVILWPWSEVTQISKLNVWLLACILRWAIQGLLALLFKLLPQVDLDLFCTKVKFDGIGCCMGKSENYIFFWKLLQP